MDRLSHYHWPGNVRQLENVLFQAVSLCEGGTVKAEHIRLPDYGVRQPLGDFSLDGGLEEIVGRFEKAVLDLLMAMGYGGAEGVATRTQLSNDQGVDGIIDQDALGLSRIYVQAKRYGPDNTVGRQAIQAFVGALAGLRLRRPAGQGAPCVADASHQPPSPKRVRNRMTPCE